MSSREEGIFRPFVPKTFEALPMQPSHSPQKFGDETFGDLNEVNLTTEPNEDDHVDESEDEEEDEEFKPTAKPKPVPDTKEALEILESKLRDIQMGTTTELDVFGMSASDQPCHLGSVGAKMIAKALQKNTTLTKISLIHHSFAPIDVMIILHVLQANKNLTHITLAYIEETARFFDDRSAGVLIALVKNSKSLKHLDLNFAGIRDQDVVALAKVLETNQTLEYLDIGQPPSREIPEDFVDYIGLKGMKALSQMLRVNKILKTLKMQGFVSEEGILNIMDALKHNQTLSTLWIHYSDFTARSVIALNQMLKKNNIYITDLNFAMDDEEGGVFDSIIDECEDEHAEINTHILRNQKLKSQGMTLLYLSCCENLEKLRLLLLTKPFLKHPEQFEHAADLQEKDLVEAKSIFQSIKMSCDMLATCKDFPEDWVSSLGTTARDLIVEIAKKFEVSETLREPAPVRELGYEIGFRTASQLLKQHSAAASERKEKQEQSGKLFLPYKRVKDMGAQHLQRGEKTAKTILSKSTSPSPFMLDVPAFQKLGLPVFQKDGPTFQKHSSDISKRGVGRGFTEPTFF